MVRTLFSKERLQHIRAVRHYASQAKRLSNELWLERNLFVCQCLLGQRSDALVKAFLSQVPICVQ
jgi:hypothetical protein